MASQIDPTPINEQYPVAGVNNSTNGMRLNFAATKSALSAAKSELDNLSGKSFSISGDGSGTSSAMNLDSGNVTIPFTLANVNANAGSYSTTSNNISFTVDAKGRITAISASAFVQVNPNPGTYTPARIPNPSITSSATNAHSYNIPTITVDAYGRTTASSLTSIPGTTLSGHYLTKGNLIVGNNSSRSSELVYPTINSNDIPPIGSEIWALTLDGSSSQGMSWKLLSFASGTLTGINDDAESGTEIIGAAPVPTIKLNMFGMTDLSDSISDDDIFMIGDTSITKSRTVTFQQMFDDLSSKGNWLEGVVSDSTPQLGGNLDVNGNVITSTSATYGTRIEGGSGTLRLNNQVWPDSAGANGQILATDGTGFCYWMPYTVSSGTVTQISAGTGLKTSSSPITTSGSISLEYSGVTLGSKSSVSGIPGSTNYMDSMKMWVVAQKSTNDISAPSSSDSHVLVRLNELNVRPTNTYYISSNGSDTLNDGSMQFPLKTLQAAHDKIPVGGNPFTIIVLPGSYAESLAITKDNVTIRGYGGVSLTVGSQSYNISLTSGLTTYVEGIRFVCTTQSGIYSSGLGNLYVKNCEFVGSTQYTTVVNLTGAQTGNVSFKNCSMYGYVISGTTVSGSPNTSFTNIETSLGPVSFKSNAVPLSLTNISTLGYVNHIAGTILLNNIDSVLGTQASNPDSLSTGIGFNSAASSGRITIRNSSFRTSLATSGAGWASIVKSGNISILLQNVDRNPTNTIATTREGWGIMDADIGSHVSYTNSATGNYTVTPYLARNYSYDMTGSITLNLDTTMPTVPSGSGLSFQYEIYVTVRQINSGNTVSFTSGSTIVWDNNTFQNINSATGSIAVWKLRYQSGGVWIGKREFAS